MPIGQMTQVPKTRERKPWTPAEKALLAIIVGVVVLAIAGTFWSKRENTLPTAVIPTPTMPAHNAFDYFDAAYRVDTQQAAIENAAAGMPPPSAPKNAPWHGPYTMAQKEALVRASGPTLRLLRQALNLPYQAPPVRSFTAQQPYYAHDRAMARLLSFVGSVAEQQGHWDVAANAHLDTIKEGELIEHESPANGMLVGSACQAIGRKPLWGDIDQLNGPQAEAAARRMERICAQQVLLADALQQEKWMGEASLQQELAAPNWRQALLRDAGYPQGPSWDPAQKTVSYFTSPTGVWYDYTSYLDDEIAAAREPYTPNDLAPSTPSDPLAATIVMDFNMLRFRCVETAAENALLTVMLALRAYDAAHGQYPLTLNALVPKYLNKVPADPFAQRNPLHYRLTGKTYLLYSVGPDGRDNHGAPLTPAPGTDNPNDFVMPGSTGDIIGGTNIE